MSERLAVVAVWLAGCASSRAVTVPTPAASAPPGSDVADVIDAADSPDDTPSSEVTASPPVASSSPPPAASLRVVHAAPDPIRDSVAVWIDGESAPRVPSLAYRSSADLEVEPGAHVIAVRSASGETAPVATVSVTLDATQTPLLIFEGIPPRRPYALSATNLDSPHVETGHTSLRFVHALAGLGSLDVCRTAPARRPPEPLAPSVPYGAPATQATLTTSGDARIQLRVHDAAPCHGPLVGVASVALPDAATVTVIATGNVGRPAVTRALLVCPDRPRAPCQVSGVADH